MNIDKAIGVGIGVSIIGVAGVYIWRTVVMTRRMDEAIALRVQRVQHQRHRPNDPVMADKSATGV